MLVDDGQAFAGEAFGLAACDPFAHGGRLAQKLVGFAALVAVEQVGAVVDPRHAGIAFLTGEVHADDGAAGEL